MNKLTGVYLEITEKCNENCPYCYNYELMRLSHSLPTRIIKDIISQIKVLGLSAITISGGEPFLHEGIADILAFAKSLKMKVSIISNGTCFSQKNLPVLLCYAPNIQLSFDGYNAETHDKTRGKGNFERITYGYRLAKELGYKGKIAIRVNIHKDNISCIGDTLETIDRVFCPQKSEDGLASVTLAYLRKSCYLENRFSSYINPAQYGNQPVIHSEIKKWNSNHSIQIHDITKTPDIGCPFNGQMEQIDCGIRIAINGEVYPCQLFSDKQFCIGNVYIETIEQIINGKMMEQFIERIHERTNSIPQCKHCAFSGICGRGCPGQAFSIYNTVNSITDRCKERKRTLSLTVQRAYEKANLSQRTE